MAKKWQKKLLSASWVHVVLSHIAATLMRGFFLTCRIERHIPEHLLPYYHGSKRAVFTFWHGRMIMLPFMKPPGEVAVLISHHNDGELITTTMKRFDIGAVRGSKKKGGSEAVRGLVDALERGANVAITPDGPRGPFQVAAPGAIYVAMRTGQPILPLAFSATRHWRLRSWDRFMIPKPFSRIAYVIGEPFTVAAESNDEQLAIDLKRLNDALNHVTAEADRLCGVTPA
jgi:lysophospholipid acyltransferase (LPLAT)-like uncharacterized protein